MFYRHTNLAVSHLCDTFMTFRFNDRRASRPLLLGARRPRDYAAAGKSWTRPGGPTATRRRPQKLNRLRGAMTQLPDPMTAINRANYQNVSLVSEYFVNTLRPAEVMIVVKYRDEIVGRRVLDIGCGAGRLIRYLARWTPHTTGIDFSAPMIEHSRRTFPKVAFALCDARDLSQFPNATFDVLFFTFNGIDTLGHPDRLRALTGMQRILSPNGLLIFSSHNRRFRNARSAPRLRFSFNPATLAMNAYHFALSTANRRIRKPMDREEAEYAVINDLAHDYSMLHYYIDRERQSAQLAGVRFSHLETYGEDGELLKPGDDDSASAELYYVARKV
jgi:ubiquinone/menaquinone biosynthesis C-methylase UbiE